MEHLLILATLLLSLGLSNAQGKIYSSNRNTILGYQREGKIIHLSNDTRLGYFRDRKIISTNNNTIEGTIVIVKSPQAIIKQYLVITTEEGLQRQRRRFFFCYNTLRMSLLPIL